MHPSTATIVLNAHIRDLQRAMHPERNRRRRLRVPRIRKGH